MKSYADRRRRQIVSLGDALFAAISSMLTVTVVDLESSQLHKKAYNMVV